MPFKFLRKVFHALFSTSDVRVKYYIKLICFFKDKKLPLMGLIFTRSLQRNYGVYISYNTEFDKTLILKHPTSIIIGEGAKIGKNVTIFQSVTIGRGDTYVDEYPQIGDNTIIYSGAVILGGIKVGANCIIGANAVVIKDVPANSVAVGVPAKCIERRDLER